jgi:hypothetical protein
MRAAAISAFLLLVVTAALYAQTLRYPLVYEDKNDPARFSRSIFEPGKDLAFNPARLLIEVSIDAGRWVSGSDPSGQHAINLGLHLLNSILFAALAWQVLPPWGAVVALGVFALHPVQVEAVAYVSGRSDLLACAGVLLALLATSFGSCAGAVVGVALACLSKETAIMAWGLVPLWAVVTAAPFPIRRFSLIGVAAAAFGASVLWVYVPAFRPVWDLALIGRTAWSVLRLAALVVLPIGQTIDHDWAGAPSWLLMASVAVLVASALWAAARIVVRAVLPRESASWPAYAIVALVLWMAPRFVMPSPEGLHEHHLVVPLLGWALCVGARLSLPRAVRV